VGDVTNSNGELDHVQHRADVPFCQT